MQKTVRTAHLSVLMTVYSFGTVYNTTQNSSDNLPSYFQTNIIAEMLSIGGEGDSCCRLHWLQHVSIHRPESYTFI